MRAADCPRCRADRQPNTDEPLYIHREHALRGLLCERFSHGQRDALRAQKTR